MGARGVHRHLDRAGPDRLPGPLGPRRRRAHPGQRQQQRQHAGREQQPAVDAAAVPLLRGHQEARRRPLDDLEALPAEQVDQHRDRRRDGDRADGDQRQGERSEQNHGPLRGALT